MPVNTVLESAIRRDRRIVIVALVVIVSLSWAYLLGGAGMKMSAIEMTRNSQSGHIGGHTMMVPAVWTTGYTVLMFFMWWIMMVAMMLPSAAPMILLFATINRRQQAADQPFVKTSVFASGYLLGWACFSLLAILLQWGLERSGILSPMLVANSDLFGAALLIAAGVYQMTPIKHACLRHCRSPLAFLSNQWRQGARGALQMGLIHGAYCIGCCWFLMALLFFGGVMNLYWIVGLALFILLEKTVPVGHWFARMTGGLLFVWGLMLLVGGY